MVKKGVLQSFLWCEPVFGIESQALLEEVSKQHQFFVLHSNRCFGLEQM